MNAHRPLAAALLYSLSVTAPPAGAQALDWDAGGEPDLSFLQPLNWSGDEVPTSAEDVRIGDGGTATVSPGEDAVFKQMFLGDPLNGPTDPMVGSGGDPNGTLTMTGGTITAQNIRIGADNTVTGTGGTGIFTLIDGAVSLNETENNSQAMEIGRAANATGTFIMGDGDSTSPTFDYTGGRFEVGQNGTSTSRFELRSGTVTGGQNFIIGQSNGTGTATTIVGGFDLPAVFTTTNEMNMNNQDATLTIEENGAVTSRDIQFANNAARTTSITVNVGGSYTNNRDMNDRAGMSVLNINGGTMHFNGTFAPGTAGREREVETLIVTDGSTLNFQIGSGVPNSFMPIQIEGDDPKSATITGEVTVGLSVNTSANNTATLDTWIGGSATWDTMSPDDAQWDLDAAPENFGAIEAGATYRILQSDVASGTTVIGTDGTTNVIPAAPAEWGVNQVLDANTDLVGYEVEALVQARVAPVTAVFDDVLADVVVGVNPSDDLTIARELGANAAQLEIEGVATFSVTTDLNIGGVVQGIVNQGALNGGGVIPVTVGGDLVFGNGGTQGGIYNVNEGTLTVAGDIVEGTNDPAVVDGAVNNAQLQINTGTAAANALKVGGGSTTQRFAVGQENGAEAGLTISGASGLSSVATTGTVAIGAGANSSKDGVPGTVAGATGEVIVGAGGTLAPTNMRIAENGDSVGTLIIDGGDVSVNSSTYVGGGATDDTDNETVGTIVLKSGSFTGGGNTEIGRDGEGFLTVDGGTFTQSDANLVVGQSGGAHDAEGTVVINAGTVVIGVVGGAANPSDLNINSSGGTVTQNAGAVMIERNLNLSNGIGDCAFVLNTGDLTVGRDISYRGGDGEDRVVVAGGALVVTRNVNCNNGANNTFAVEGSAASIGVTGNFTCNASATLVFSCDAGGITPIDVTGTLNLNGATLAVDVSGLGNGSAFDLSPITLATSPTISNAFGNVAFDEPVAATSFPDGSGYLLRNAGGALFLEAAITRDPLGDDDGDGIVNLLEQAFGSDLNDPNDGFDALPMVSTDGAGVTMIFRRITDEEKFVYEIQQSTDAVNWTFLPTAPETSLDQSGVPAGYERQQVAVTIDPGEPRKLLRIDVIID